MEATPAIDVVTTALAPLGVGGVLAGVMFWFYRRDAREYSERWQGMNETLMRVVQENTRVYQELVVLIKERLPRQ